MELGRRGKVQQKYSHVQWDSGDVSQFSIQPLVPDTSYAIQSPKSMKEQYAKGYHAFAFAWFRVPEIEKKEDDVSNSSQGLEISGTDLTERRGSSRRPSKKQFPIKVGFGSKSELSQSLLSVSKNAFRHIRYVKAPPFSSRLDTPNENGNIDDDSINSTAEVRKATLPALSVLNKLHQQPYHKHQVYTVELMGYDECFNNLDSKVNRETWWCDAFRVWIQSLFLPLFVAIPPRWWIQCFKKDFKIRPRARPVDTMVPQFEVHVFHRNYFSFSAVPINVKKYFIFCTGSRANGTNTMGYHSSMEDSGW